MSLKPIKETVKKHGQFVIKYEDDKTPVFLADRISAGIAWPTVEKNGYFCIVADQADKPINPGVESKPVTIIAEGERALLPGLFEAVTWQMVKTGGTRLYAQHNPAVIGKPGFDGNNKAFVTAFNDYKQKRIALNNLKLQPPLITDWLVGILTTQKWQEVGALKVPKETIMYGQLKSMMKADRKQTEQDRFPSMTALVCAMTPFIVTIAQKQGLRAVTPSKYVW